MSDGEADPELLELLRQSLGMSKHPHDEISNDTGVLKDAEFIYNNAIDVSVDMLGTKSAAVEVYRAMQQRSYSTETWGQHELHPNVSDGFTEVDILNFVFTLDLLNFSFWSHLPENERFQVDYKGKRWTGYNSLVASLRRALDDGVPITTPRFWRSHQCSEQVLAYVFRSATAEEIPLLAERICILREASHVLREDFADGEVDSSDEEDVPFAPVDPDEATHSKIDASDAAQEFHDPGHKSDDRDHIIEGVKPSQSDRNDEIEAPQQDGAAVEAPHSVASSTNLSGPTFVSNLPDIKIDQLNLDETATSSLANDSRSRPEIESESGVPSGGSDNDVLPSERQRTVGAAASEVANEAPTSQVHIVHAATNGRLDQKPDLTVLQLVQQADHSAGKLVNLLAKHFPGFRDETRFEGRRVRILKRAQIFVADLWAALNGAGVGEFHDIGHLTMFADYRVTQCLHSLGVLAFSPPLDHHIRSGKDIESGHSWEVQLRGCSVWAVELIRREIARSHPNAEGSVNAVLIDFFLYDLAKEREAEGVSGIPTHRTRSVWY